MTLTVYWKPTTCIRPAFRKGLVITKYIKSNLCITTTLWTFQNGLKRQMVVLFRLGFNHPFTNAFTDSNEYHIMTMNIAESQLQML